MRIYKTKIFHKWIKANKITGGILKDTTKEIVAGLIDVHLGGGVYKKRIQTTNKGKSGGARVILAYKEGDRVVFLYGFNKNERDNITNKEKEAFKKLANFYLNLTDLVINKALLIQELMEVKLWVQKF